MNRFNPSSGYEPEPSQINMRLGPLYPVPPQPSYYQEALVPPNVMPGSPLPYWVTTPPPKQQPTFVHYQGPTITNVYYPTTPSADVQRNPAPPPPSSNLHRSPTPPPVDFQRNQTPIGRAESRQSDLTSESRPCQPSEQQHGVVDVYRGNRWNDEGRRTADTGYNSASSFTRDGQDFNECHDNDRDKRKEENRNENERLHFSRFSLAKTERDERGSKWSHRVSSRWSSELDRVPYQTSRSGSDDNRRPSYNPERNRANSSERMRRREKDSMSSGRRIKTDEEPSRNNKTAFDSRGRRDSTSRTSTVDTSGHGSSSSARSSSKDSQGAAISRTATSSSFKANFSTNGYNSAHGNSSVVKTPKNEHFSQSRSMSVPPCDIRSSMVFKSCSNSIFNNVASTSVASTSTQARKDAARTREVLTWMTTCRCCFNRMFPSRADATKHFKKEHQQKICCFCFELFPIVGPDFDRHFDVKHNKDGDWKEKCPVCGDKYTKEGIKTHLSVAHLLPLERRFNGM